MATMMQARVHDINELILDQVAVPDLGSDDVLLQVLYCGICGSDFGFAASGGLAGPGNPMAIGHEFSAQVHSMGSDISNLHVGDRVVINPLAASNFIGNGGSQGAFSNFVLLKNYPGSSDLVYKMPTEMSDRAGALVEPMAVSAHALRRGRLVEGDNVLVVGVGPIGLGAVLAAKHFNASSIVAADLSEHRLALANKLGAKTVKGTGGELTTVLQKQFGMRAALFGEFVDTQVIIETTGSDKVLSALIELAAPGTRIVTVAMPKKPAEHFDFTPVMTKEIELIGTLGYGESFPEALNIIAANAEHIDTLVSHDFPLSQFTNAFATAQKADIAAKVLVDCQS